MENQEKIFKQCNALLDGMLGDPKVRELWWQAPNKAFGYDAPGTVFSVAPNTVLSYLMRCAEGEW